MAYMDNKSAIDASLGLDFALQALEEYRQSGVLQAYISLGRFLRTEWYRCTIQITNGRVVACVLENEQKGFLSMGVNQLRQIDQKRGPFAWTFHPQVAQPQIAMKRLPSPQDLNTTLPVQSVQRDAIPVRLVRALNLDWLTSWDFESKRVLGQVFSLIDGRRTVGEIKMLLPRLSAEAVERAIVILIAMECITIHQKL